MSQHIPPTILSTLLLNAFSAVAYGASVDSPPALSEIEYLPSIQHLTALGWAAKDHDMRTMKDRLYLTELGLQAFCQLHDLPYEPGKYNALRGISREKYRDLRAENCLTDACGLLPALARPAY